MPHLLRKSSPLWGEFFIIVLTFVIGSLMAWYVYRLGLTTYLTDQSAHLNFSRLTFDSITPGISQIGFWPPLLHVFMIPFVAVPFLFTSGLAGAFVLIPSLALAAFFLYRITLMFTGNKILSAVAGTLLILNPFILYFSVTPMMEVLFIANVFGTAYFMGRWLQTNDLIHLLLVGLFVSLACLSRYEGLILLPITASVILLRMRHQRKSYQQMEAMALLFGLLAIIGIVSIMVYSSVYGDNPLTFTGGAWIRDPQISLKLARLDILKSLQYVLTASFHMIGDYSVIFSLASVIPLFFLVKRKFEHAVVLFILIAPFLFILISVFAGAITINVPDLPPFKFFHNDRYGLTWIGFTIVTPILFIHHIQSAMSRYRYFRLAGIGFATVLCSLLLLNASYELVSAAYIQNFFVIRMNVNSPSTQQYQVADFLRSNYDGGKILSARVDNDPIFAEAGIPYSQYIYEGNYLFFNQALREPWLFARWVIMHQPGDLDGWVAANEPVYRQWGESADFTHYYDVVFENGTRRVYRLKDDILRQTAEDNKYVMEAIPSLNPRLITWNPSTIYAEIRAPEDVRKNAEALANNPKQVRRNLLVFYENRLKPQYAQGYYVDDQRRGNSESQSYALLQSLWTDDERTFDVVWNWTKQHIQRADKLFSWQFSVDDGGTVTISDENSATDADTDIAYALLLAGNKWNRAEFTREGRDIVRSIWENETAETISGRHVTAGNWADTPESIVINPSYFTPYAYRLFRTYDPEHDWNQVIETGYRDIHRVSAASAPKKPNAFLPPNWFELVKNEAETIRPFSGKPESLDYSYDAFRTFARVSMDEQLYPQNQAKDYLDNVTVFDEEWTSNTRVCTVYILSSEQDADACLFSKGTLAGPFSIWLVTNPQRVEDMLVTYYFSSGNVDLPQSSAYYEASWYFFALWQWTESEL